jgi:hypothetical protein
LSFGSSPTPVAFVASKTTAPESSSSAANSMCCHHIIQPLPTRFREVPKKAGVLLSHPALAAWLHRSSSFVAANLYCEEGRRCIWEGAAAREAESQSLTTESDVDWARVSPVPNAALDSLGKPDRYVVVLRYLSDFPFSHIGNALRENSAAPAAVTAGVNAQFDATADA